MRGGGGMDGDEGQQVGDRYYLLPVDEGVGSHPSQGTWFRSDSRCKAFFCFSAADTLRGGRGGGAGWLGSLRIDPPASHPPLGGGGGGGHGGGH